MSRLAVSLLVLTLAFAVTRGEPNLTASLLRQYDAAFAGLGALSIFFMVVVVAASGGGGAAPRFRPAASPPAARCPVCASGGEGDWVACTKCDTPHHAECVRYAAKCGVFGCSGGEGAPKG
jgi:hypothetical protein